MHPPSISTTMPATLLEADGVGFDARVVVSLSGDAATCKAVYAHIGDALIPITSEEVFGPSVTTEDVRLAASAFTRMTGAPREAVEDAMLRARRGEREDLARLLDAHRFAYLQGIRDSSLLSYLARVEGEHVLRQREDGQEIASDLARETAEEMMGGVR